MSFKPIIVETPEGLSIELDCNISTKRYVDNPRVRAIQKQSTAYLIREHEVYELMDYTSISNKIINYEFAKYHLPIMIGRYL